MQRGARTRGGHRESARSGDADDGEDAEVDSALPRRRYVVRDHGLLLGLGVVLLLGLGSVGLLGLGASPGLLLDLDLERAELVVPSKDVILPKRGREGRAEDFSLLWAAGRGRRVRRKGQGFIATAYIDGSDEGRPLKSNGRVPGWLGV